MANEVGFWNFRIRRWLGLLGVTALIQTAAIMLAPQLVEACPGPYLDVVIVMCIPIVWSVVLLAIYRTTAEKVVAYGGFFLSAAGLLAIQTLTLS